MHRTASFHRHRRVSCRGFAAVIPLAIAAFLSIMLMTACHSTPTQQLAKAPDAPPATAVVSVAAGVEQAPLSSMLFDEHFYTPPADDDEVASN